MAARLEINEFLSKGSKIYVGLSSGRGRGIFVNTPVLKNSILATSTPLVAIPNNKIKLRLDRVCNHCYQSIKNPCQSCLDQPELYEELKQDHEEILEIKKLYHEAGLSNSVVEHLLQKLVLRICHETRQGYQNTLYFLDSFMSPQVPPNATEMLQEDYEFLVDYLKTLDYEEELNTFLTLEWYVKTIGLIYINCLSTSQGAAMYDIFTFLNHSCQPNVKLEFQGMIASIKAIENISSDEELFVDYSTVREEFHQFELEEGSGKSSVARGSGSQEEAVEKRKRERKRSFLQDIYGFDCLEFCNCK